MKNHRQGRRQLLQSAFIFLVPIPLPFRFFCCLWLLAFLCFGIKTSAQDARQHLADDDNKFIAHLLENRFYDESVLFLKELQLTPFKSASNDSILYWLGVSYYYKKDLDSSNKYLLAMKEKEQEVFEKARILQGFNFIYLRQYEEGKNSIRASAFSYPALNDFAHVELATIALLEKDTLAFNNLASQFHKNSHYAVARAEKALMLHNESMRQLKSRSPFLAGVSSALVPGLGKVYVGKTGQGISSFMICAVLGAQAWEAYYRSSWRSPYFFVYGGLFTVFYVGNIYGSVKIARNYNQEKYEAIRSQVLIDLHIPLRTVLDL